MIFTGNYSSCYGENCISISKDKGKKASYTGNVYSKLAFELSFLEKCKISKLSKIEKEMYYTRKFYDQVLKDLDPREVYNELDHSILLSYEQYNEFSHRHLVAFWLEECLGVSVYEIVFLNEEDCIFLSRPEYIRNILIDVMKN